MATRDEIYQAIRNADKAGDAASVQQLAAYLQTMPDATAAPKRGTGSDTLDAANAVSSGFNRGAVRMLGMPVDTVANVIDLGKAGLGSAYTAMTGKPAPEALQLGDRKNVVGSGDYLVDKLGRTSIGNAAINPANPEYEGGYLQAGGAGLNAVINPNSRAQALNQAVLGVTSALGGKAAYDATGNPALAVAASLAPSGVQQAVTAGTKYVVRGGEQGRRQMEQRIQDLKDAGIDNPTMGLASGSKLIGGVENLLQNTPGAVGVIGRSRDAALNGLRTKAEEAAALASSNRGALEAGVSIQGGIRGFKDRFKANQEALYDNLDTHIPGRSPTDITNTRETLGRLNADITGAPALSKFFKNEKIQALEAALQQDTSGSPQSVHVYPQPDITGVRALALNLRNGRALSTPIPQEPIQVVIPEGPQRNTLPFEAVKKTRTLVGNELADNSLMSTVPSSKWRALYGGLSEDIGNTARATGPQAEGAFNRATDYTRAGSQRLERVAPFAQAVAPEQAFTAMVNASKENVSTLQAVKKTLPPDARGSVAGTVIERLGKATNGVQNESGTNWSPETFLTNWNKMTPKAREELFSGFKNSAEVKANVESVAKATSMMRDSSKMWANPSGSGANVAARGMMGALSVGGGASLAGLLNPLVPVGVAGGMGGANLLARALTNRNAVDAMTKQNALSPQLMGAQTIPLFSTGEF